MKFTIVINQKVIIEKKYRIDIIDAAILGFIYDWTNSPYSKRMTEGAVLYVWMNPKKICEQLPILNLKPDTVYRRMKNLVKSEFLIAHPDNTSTSQCWYAVTALVADMYFEKPKDIPTETTNPAPARTTALPDESSPTSETFTVSVPKSDPSETQIRPLGFESKEPGFSSVPTSDLNPRPVGFESAYYNTIISNTILEDKVVVVTRAPVREETPDNNDNFIPDCVLRDREKARQFREEASNRPRVTEENKWCTVQGTDHSRETLTTLLQKLTTGERGRIFHKQNKIAPADVIPRFVEDRAMNRNFNTETYLATCLGLFAGDLVDYQKKLLEQTNLTDSSFEYEFKG